MSSITSTSSESTDSPEGEGTESTNDFRKFFWIIGLVLAVAILGGSTLWWMLSSDTGSSAPSDTGTQAVVVTAPNKPYVVSTSCDGPQATANIDLRQMIFPDNCLATVEVLNGVITVQGKDGKEIRQNNAGVMDPIPTGFRARRIWSDNGAQVNVTLNPDPDPLHDHV